MYLRKNVQVSDSYKKMILGFVIVAVLLIVIIVYFASGHAVIHVTAKATTINTDFVVNVATDGGTAGKDTLSGLLYETKVESTIEGQATGAKAVSGNNVGSVTVYNNRGESQTLVKTTRLLSPENILLRLSERVVVPANGKVIVLVYADNPASFSEIQPTKFTIPGLNQALQSLIYAQNDSVLKSSGQSIKVIKAVDIARAQDQLSADLTSKALQEFSKQLPNSDYTAVAVGKQVIDSSVSDKPETVKDAFIVKMQMSVTMVGINQKDILNIANDRLKAAVPTGKELRKINLDKFAYATQNFDDKTKVLNLRVQAAGDAVIGADNVIFAKDKLSDLTPKGVEVYLESFSDQIDSVAVDLSPFWVKRVPGLPDRIQVIVDAPSL
ncbi:MAG: hypothetical protein V1763_02390 [Parcubacteria group bacterium]